MQTPQPYKIRAIGLISTEINEKLTESLMAEIKEQQDRHRDVSYEITTCSPEPGTLVYTASWTAKGHS